MSIITFQFGQCGNQVGQSLYSHIYEDISCDFQRIKCSQSFNNDYVECSKNAWFTTSKKGELIAKSILVDTENKVTATANKSIPYKFKNIVSGGYGGSANNWACGYNSKSKLLIGEILETTRKEIEKCNFVRSFVNILGAGGGTGSGVGSYSIERLREEFPSKIIINCLVLPHEKGEVVTQNYNTLHTLAKLYDISDASILFSNDLLYKLCTRNLCIEDAGLQNFNGIIAQHLAGVFQPLQESNYPEPILELVAHPDYKFLNVHSAPLLPKEHLHYESTITKQIILNQLERSLKNFYSDIPAPNKQNQGLISKVKCIGNILITRGEHSASKDKFLNEKSYAPWVPKESRLTHLFHRRSLKEAELSTTLVSNNNCCSLYLNSIIEDAWLLFTSGAYLQHYRKFGTNEQHFLQAFEKLEAILLKYRSL